MSSRARAPIASGKESEKKGAEAGARMIRWKRRLDRRGGRRACLRPAFSFWRCLCFVASIALGPSTAPYMLAPWCGASLFVSTPIATTTPLDRIAVTLCRLFFSPATSYSFPSFPFCTGGRRQDHAHVSLFAHLFNPWPPFLPFGAMPASPSFFFYPLGARACVGAHETHCPGVWAKNNGDHIEHLASFPFFLFSFASRK